MDGVVGLINCDIDKLQYSKVSLTMSTSKKPLETKNVPIGPCVYMLAGRSVHLYF